MPTEVSVSNPNDPNTWQLAGDDLTRGWLWTYQKYDWMGRVVRKINTDGTDSPVLNDSDVLISYDGCGCAGGVVTTVEGERVPIPGTSNFGRRKQNIHEDILGRVTKVFSFAWNGDVYSTVTNAYNGRDQVTETIQYSGGESTSNPHQISTMSYDGHGRLKTQHRPEQNTGTVTTYNYNTDSSISSVVDARGAVTTLTYNDPRGLLTQTSYSVPTGSTIPVTPTATFGYDNIGNRISMTDGLGTVAYAYNELSRMTSETRDFTDNLADAPTGGVFTLEYTYNLSGGLKSLKDPYGQQFNYAHDRVGRLQTVTGSTAFNVITNYASTPSYNARGTLTALNYGNGTAMAVTAFNNKLQATEFEVKKGTTPIIEKQYQFYNDGSLKFVKDDIDAKFDRLYKYDHAGRTVDSKSGVEARGGTDTQLINIPYSRQYQHNAFGNITQMSGRYYNTPDTTNYIFTNGRNPNWTYDAEGNTISDADAVFKYDAAGRTVSTTEYEFYSAPTASYFDGTGELAKRTSNFGSTTPAPETNYFIRSSVLNKVVAETTATGAKQKTFVPANGVTLAEQSFNNYTTPPSEKLAFIHQDASSVSVQQTDMNGVAGQSGIRAGEYDAMGRNVADPGPYVTLDTTPPSSDGSGIDLFGSGEGYRPGRQTFRVDGLVVPESQFMTYIESGWIGGAFGLLEMSTRMSTRFLGIRESGVRWGSPFTHTRWTDGSRTTNWGTFNPDLSQVNYSTTTVIYDQSWTINWSLIPQTQQPLGGSGQTKYTNKNEAIRKAIEDADSILSGNSDCAKFFGKYALKALAALDGLLQRGVIDTLSNVRTGIRMQMPKNESPTDFMGDATTVGNTLTQERAYRVFKTGTVNSQGPFFNMLSPARIGDYNPNGRQSRVLQILHELAHMVYKPDGNGGYTPLIPNDGGSGGGDSEENTEKILEKCKAEIEKLGKKKK